jgi:hypothetical protein
MASESTIVAVKDPENWIQIIKFKKDSNPELILSTSAETISIGFVEIASAMSYDGTSVDSTDLKPCGIDCNIFNGFKMEKCTKTESKKIECDNKTELILFQVKTAQNQDKVFYYSISDVKLSFDSFKQTLFVSSSVIKKLVPDKMDEMWCPYLPLVSNSSTKATQAIADYVAFLTTKCPVIFYLFCIDDNITSNKDTSEYLKHLLNMMIIDVSTILTTDNDETLEQIINNASGNLTRDIKKKISHLLSKIEQSTGVQYNLPILYVTPMDYPKLISALTTEKQNQLNALLLEKCTNFNAFINAESNRITAATFFNNMRTTYENNSSHPWGFVKLNLIPNGADLEPTQRLSIKTCIKDTTLLIDAVVDNQLMYVRNEGTKQMVMNPNYQESELKMGKSNGVSKFTKNNENKLSKQVFGPFKKIFPHGIQNDAIAQDREIKKILDIIKTPGGIAFAIGYGGSGAGKTSTLVYFNKGKTEKERIGMLIQLCNEMRDFATTITVHSVELCQSNDDYRGCDAKEFIDGGIAFEWYANQRDGWQPYKAGEPFVAGYYTKQDGLTIKNKKRIDSLVNLGEISRDKIISALGSTDAINIKWCSIGQLSQLVVDSNRHVAGTSNNPNSSRSHDIVKYVFNLNNGAGKSLMVVGDLAGSESKFACDVPSMVNAFANLKNDNDKSGKKYYYYNADVPEERTDIADFSNDDKVVEMFELSDKSLLNCAKGVFFLMTSSKYKTTPNNINNSLLPDKTILKYLLLPDSTQPSLLEQGYLNAAWEKGLKSSTAIFSTSGAIRSDLMLPTDVQESIVKFNSLVTKLKPDDDPPALVAPEDKTELKNHVNQFLCNDNEVIVKDMSKTIILENSIYDKFKPINLAGYSVIKIVSDSTNNVSGKITELANCPTFSKLLLTKYLKRIPTKFYESVKMIGTNLFTVDKCFKLKDKLLTAEIEIIVDQLVKHKTEKNIYYIGLFGDGFTDRLTVNDDVDQETPLICMLKIAKSKTTDSTTQISTNVYSVEVMLYNLTAKLSLTDTTKPTGSTPVVFYTETIQPIINFLSSQKLNTSKSFNNGKYTVETKVKPNWQGHVCVLKQNDDSYFTKLNTIDCAIAVPELGNIKVPGTMTITVNTAASTTAARSLRYQLEASLITKTPAERQKIVQILESYKNYIGIRKLVIEKCNLRTSEGIMINKLLSDMRKAIEIIYSVKNAKRATLPLSVLYGTDMFKKPLDQILFNKEITDDIIIKAINESDIIFSIFNFVIAKNIIVFQQGDATLAQKYAKICQQMTVILICVINISKMTEKKTAEDNLQYLSINGLQKLYQEIDIKKRSIKTGAELDEYKTQIITFIQQYYAILDKYKTEAGRVCSVNSDALQLKNAVGNPNYKKQGDAFSFSKEVNGCRDKSYEKDLQSIMESIYDEGKEQEKQWSLLHVLMRIRILDTDSPKQKQQNIDLFISTLKSIIDLFDNFNSPTTLGTVKAMSKLLNGVSTDILQSDYPTTLGPSMRLTNLTENEIAV